MRSNDAVFLWLDGTEVCDFPGAGEFVVESMEECLRLWFMLRTDAADGRVGETKGGEEGVLCASGEVASINGTGE